MKAVALVSAGIDSPVAAYLMMKQGADVIALHMDNRPFTDDREIEKAGDLVRRLEEICEEGKNAGEIKENVRVTALMAPHGHAQAQFAKHCDRRYGCLLCKRQMYRVAEAVAERYDAAAMITGESLGQVASQTMENLRVESQAISIPIWRPLIGLDKVEIIRIAEGIGTFDISIRPGLCCTITPSKPATRGRIEKMLAEEAKLVDPSVEDLVRQAVEGLTEI